MTHRVASTLQRLAARRGTDSFGALNRFGCAPGGPVGVRSMSASQAAAKAAASSPKHGDATGEDAFPVRRAIEVNLTRALDPVHLEVINESHVSCR